ncbi:MAG: hypothetical protein ACOC1F_12105 [Myxococcota bacterium]
MALTFDDDEFCHKVLVRPFWVVGSGARVLCDGRLKVDWGEHEKSAVKAAGMVSALEKIPPAVRDVMHGVRMPKEVFSFVRWRESCLTAGMTVRLTGVIRHEVRPGLGEADCRKEAPIAVLGPEREGVEAEVEAKVLAVP